MDNISHQPVLIKEIIEILQPIENGIFIDATFGAGGYTKSILEQGAKKVYSIDQDPEVEKYVIEVQKKFGSQFSFVKANFSDLDILLREQKIEQADGIVFDLGVSSMQLNEAERGFSFNKLGDLDMRMSKEGLSAYDFIHQASEEELANIIYQYGDEKYSRRIAKRIVLTRQNKAINNTLELAKIIKEAIPYQRKEKIDPATRTFQAIRIYVNDELSMIEKALSKVANILKPGGKLIMVSFHSLEDRIIKDFLRNNSAPKMATSKYSKVEILEGHDFKILNRKVIIPSEEEIKFNPRSRSAKLRAATRTNLHEEKTC